VSSIPIVRCDWLKRLQDPLVHCQAAEGLLDVGPDVVSSGAGRCGRSPVTVGAGCETESACSCSVSCSGSCADSGRAPSEDDDQKQSASLPASAATTRSFIHRPLLAKSADTHGETYSVFFFIDYFIKNCICYRHVGRGRRGDRWGG